MHEFSRSMIFGAVLLVSTALASAAQAIDLNDFRLQDVLPIFSEMKNLAKLSNNQQALWLQVEAKTKSLQRTRDERRQEIQSSVKNRLKERAPELRDVIILMNQDDMTTAQENKELREAWMGFYDALSDAQRDVVAQMLSDQLMRIPDRGNSPRGDARGEGQHGLRGGGMGANMGGGSPPNNGNF